MCGVDVKHRTLGRSTPKNEELVTILSRSEETSLGIGDDCCGSDEGFDGL
jgi:hypothetical protein